MNETARSRSRRPILIAALVAAAALAACEQKLPPDDDLQAIRAPEIVRTVPASEALAGAHVLTLDPATLNEAQIRSALGTMPRCDFRYTSHGKPVLAVGMHADGGVARAIVKLNGYLVPLQGAASGTPGEQDGSLVAAAGPVRLSISPAREPFQSRDGVRKREADMMFEVGDRLKVGYRGYLECSDTPKAAAGR